MNLKPRITRAVVSAGLGVALSLGATPFAFAETGASNTPVEGEAANPGYTAQVQGSSKGDTKLYVIGTQDDLTTSEGSVTENVKVSIPVAIHYVADSEGNLHGPSDGVAKFVNHTKLGAVHVSKIAVQNAGDARIGLDSNDLTSDQMSFFVTPTPGTSDKDGAGFTADVDDAGNTKTGTQDQLGAYVSETGDVIRKDPTHKNEWNIAQNNGALALNGLTGRIGGFDHMDPSTDYQAGTIHWTVRAGTRAQADAKDATVSIHFNSNNGANADCVPLADQYVQVLKEDASGTFVADEAALQTAIARGADDLEAPKAHTNADGSVTSYAFAGWNTKADGSGKTIKTVGDLGAAASIAGTVQEVYAIFAEA